MDPVLPLIRLNEVAPHVRIELRYATPRNFTGRALYASGVAWLRVETAEKLRRAAEVLSGRGLGLKVWDAYRPPSAQLALWTACPDERYVARPERGSRHTRGTAVDVTLVGEGGRELEMPTGYDDFSERAGRDWPDVTVLARRHRQCLRETMEGTGFVSLETEWWHFDDANWRSHPLLSIEWDDLEGAVRTVVEKGEGRE